MKLLTTIAAVLISVSAFSQDLILYHDGTFSQNGEEISLEQITNMTMTYNVGKKDLLKRLNSDTQALHFRVGSKLGQTSQRVLFLLVLALLFGSLGIQMINTVI